jgi:glycosyltransferase involved in cell wall biosynthesis
LALFFGHQDLMERLMRLVYDDSLSLSYTGWNLSQKKKIAIVITRLDLGGAQEVALESAARLDPQHFEVELLAGPGGMLDAEAWRRLGPRYVQIPSLKHPISPLNDIRAFIWLLFHFYRRRTDIVHTHSSKAGLLGRLAAWAAGVPKIVHTVHGWSFHDQMPNPTRWFYILLERMLAKLTDTLCVVAHSCKDKGLLNGIGQPGQYRPLRAGIDLEAWQNARLSPHQGVVVGCIANCKPQKNPLDFVRVAHEAIKLAPQASFVYAGDGPLRGEAQALAESLGIAGRVKFSGWVSDPLALASSFDIFLLCSLWEGLPCVFPQMLALGIPVVATQVDGASEIIREGVNGYLCQGGDIAALADRVAALANDTSLRTRLGAAAKSGVPAEFGLEDMVLKAATIYGEP